MKPVKDSALVEPDFDLQIKKCSEISMYMLVLNPHSQRFVFVICLVLSVVILLTFGI